jgi:hypothetical protein
MLKIAGLTLAALTLSAAAHADVDLKLGSSERVTRLFAYPTTAASSAFATGRWSRPSPTT